MAPILPAFTSRVELAQAVSERDALVVLMLVIEVDPFDPEPLERCLACRGDGIGREPGHEPDLGGDHHLVPLGRIALEPAADDRLALAALMARHPGRIDIGSVDHRSAGVDESVEDGEAGGLIRRPSEHIAAERQRRDLDAAVADGALFHARLLLRHAERVSASIFERPPFTRMDPETSSG